MTTPATPAPAQAGASASPELLARLDEIGRVNEWADASIDEALLTGVPVLDVARRTGRNRSALHQRRARLLDQT